ncbi:MAG: hypothetical protein EOP04_25510 [Proteobacteria bacterium]|nr:MAG: hypothetical protein EOP04_25510 [Pseudomonadota bacterium]
MKKSFMLTGLILGFAQLAYAEPIPYPKDKELRKPIGGNGTSFVCRIEDSCTETSNIPADVPKAFIEALSVRLIVLTSPVIISGLVCILFKLSALVLSIFTPLLFLLN